MTTIVNINPSSRQPGCLVQLLWFLAIGWWASACAVGLAYFFMLTIVGIPLGVMIVNQLPKIIALREPGKAQGGVTVVTTPGTAVVNIGGGQVRQTNFLVRAVYFLLVGWWLCGIWMSIAWAISCTIIGLPLGLIMFDKVPALLSLHKA